MKYVLHLAARQLPDPSCGGLNSGLFLPASAPHCGYWVGWGGDLILYCELEIQRYGLV